MKGFAGTRKTFQHPAVGRIVLDYRMFDVRDASGQYLLVGIAEPNRASADALALLGSLHAVADQPR
ncbi:hypothetical protein AB0F91_24835 [Amycolatopsis sp. NPDC023774]|uniref:MmyB family transcriptional regulator n=1 Tax=Amycolatopsis sp. NPDC023774 TaxID=3155015 RepID=UPI00340CEB1C